MSDGRSSNTLYRCATSRGTRHVAALHGNAANGVHITDDYGAYRNLSGQQQLCWARLYRVIRDLRYNSELPEAQKASVTAWYEHFSDIYQDLRTYLTESFDVSKRTSQAAELWKQTRALAHRPAPLAGEPDKLRRLKVQLLRAGKDKLFTCLIKDTPCDNNRAERDLRQLVLKRKRSFGSKTIHGAQAFATILSICTTTWRSNQQGYFEALKAIG
jgi:transposase